MKCPRNYRLLNFFAKEHLYPLTEKIAWRGEMLSFIASWNAETDGGWRGRRTSFWSEKRAAQFTNLTEWHAGGNHGSFDCNNAGKDFLFFFSFFKSFSRIWQLIYISNCFLNILSAKTLCLCRPAILMVWPLTCPLQTDLQRDVTQALFNQTRYQQLVRRVMFN